MRILTALFFAVSFFAAAQGPEVPHKMSFADMTLTIRDDARREIQKDVDALHQSPKHFNIKADRARIYFPVIEKIFAEEGVPDDFKFLVLQESSLIADAVSVSNAVGFWQFKDFTAIEMGLRVDRQIDERMSIAASSRAAARYIKKNNTFFDNWIYALQAYQMGAGGVMKSEKDTHAGEKHAEITSKTYWYVKKFLAHKIAFQGSVGGKGQVELVVLDNNKKTSLADLARQIQVDEEELKSYNKWTKSGDIPDDRRYAVLVPYTTGVKLPETNPVAVAAKVEAKTAQQAKDAPRSNVTKKINGVRAIQVIEGEKPADVARRADVDLVAFLNWNDIGYNTPLVAGGWYFLAKKRNRASVDFHTVAPGEDLWSISQRYGVKMKKLKRFNRLETSMITAGTSLYLSSMKPRGRKIDPTAPAIPVVDEEAFTWSETPQQRPVSETDPIAVVASADTTTIQVLAPVETKAADSLEILQPQKEPQVSPDTAAMQPIVITSPGNGLHVVQPKETLYAISKIYQVGVMDLVAWNDLDLQQGIKVGQELRVTAPQESGTVEPKQEVELVHEVQPTDTLYGIARKYGVTIKQIMDWNEKKDFSLSVGEKLKVKSVQ